MSSSTTAAVPHVKPKAISKQQLTAQQSIVFWREVYGVLGPAFRERLAATTAPDTPAEHQPLSDDDVIRFLAEWAGNVSYAVSQCQRAQAWRQANFPIPRSEVLPTLRTQKLIFPHGVDRAGRPVCYYRTKLHDPRAFTPEETLRAVVYLYEELQARARRPGFVGVREEACVVLDWTDGSFSNFDVEFIKLFIRTSKLVYPSRLECFLVYPANILFKALWAVIKPFLDAKSRGATFLVQTKAELTEFIAEDQLASFLGGGLPYEPKEVEAEGEETN